MATQAKTPIMAHMVIGYPSLAESRTIAEKYIASGMEILELQIPFSHPTADGTVLTEANRKAVEGGTTMQDALAFLSSLRQDYPEQKIMAMTYLNKLFAYGLEGFCQRLAGLNIGHIIIPDLPFDSPLANTIHQAKGVQLVPVISANTAQARLSSMIEKSPDYFYLMADYKITGGHFSINPKIQQVVDYIRQHSSAKIGLGFGISDRKQVEEVLKIVDFAIIGSALTKAVEEGNIQEKLTALAN